MQLYWDNLLKHVPRKYKEDGCTGFIPRCSRLFLVLLL